MDIEAFRSKARQAIRHEVFTTPLTVAQQNDEQAVERMTESLFQSALDQLAPSERESVLAEAARLGRLPAATDSIPDARVKALWNHLRGELVLWLQAVAPLFKVKN